MIHTEATNEMKRSNAIVRISETLSSSHRREQTERLQLRDKCCPISLDSLLLCVFVEKRSVSVAQMPR